ncbi:hypothetical protein [Clostridium sp. D33t1_170424_F3]|uniref:hypothetical protein n=1 Tax=Clostridium sp. D33t1_170424_F3 TaxID=2787099 RepID=UPI0018A9F797|nr:hypothetical protein [Clostridium sp. D33t1_170424_F3]
MKKLVSILLVMVVVLSMGVTGFAAPVSDVVETEKEIVYQDEDYTVVATPIMTKEEADAYFQHLIETRGVDAVSLPDQSDEFSISPRATKTYSASEKFSFSGLNESVKLVFSATTSNTTSTDIGKLVSARVNANSTSGTKNTITYQYYDKKLLDGGRTYALNFSFDIEQETASVTGGTNIYYDSGAAIFEIYSTGGSYVY